MIKPREAYVFLVAEDGILRLRESLERKIKSASYPGLKLGPKEHVVLGVWYDTLDTAMQEANLGALDTLESVDSGNFDIVNKQIFDDLFPKTKDYFQRMADPKATLVYIIAKERQGSSFIPINAATHRDKWEMKLHYELEQKCDIDRSSTMFWDNGTAYAFLAHKKCL
jgi:hypothetical protein